jgi:hypothetical protein
MKRISIVAAALCLVLPAVGSAAETQRVLPKQPTYVSDTPLYFRLAFGREGKASMLGVLDQTWDLSPGYTVAYVDENMDNDLTNDAPKKFRWRRSGLFGLERTYDPQFTVKGPVGDDRAAAGKVAGYRIVLLGLEGKISLPADYPLYCLVSVDNWELTWINGRIRFYGTPAEALEGRPVRFGAPLAWDISSVVVEKQVVISSALKDKNGSNLRMVVRPGGLESPQRDRTKEVRALNAAANSVSPRLTLLKDGKTVVDEKLAFG